MNYARGITTMAALAVLSIGVSSAALGPERALAGVSIGSKGIIVLRRYGNPNIVTPGLGGAGGGAAGANAGAAPDAANPYATGPGGLPPGVSAPGGGANPYAAYNPYARSGGGGSGAKFSGGASYGGGPAATPGLAPGGAEATMGGDNAQMADTTGLVTWTYQRMSGNATVNFRLDEDGKVVEVTATGTRPSPLARTARGVNLGDPYGKVLRLYGFPEESTTAGKFVTVKYTKSAHIAFQFYNLKLVRIAVAKLTKPTSVTL